MNNKSRFGISLLALIMLLWKVVTQPCHSTCFTEVASASNCTTKASISGCGYCDSSLLLNAGTC